MASDNLIEKKVGEMMELIDSKLEFLPSDNELTYGKAEEAAQARKRLKIENTLRSTFIQICEAVATVQNETVHREVQKIKPLMTELAFEVKKLDALADQSVPKVEMETPEGTQVSFFINKN